MNELRDSFYDLVVGVAASLIASYLVAKRSAITKALVAIWSRLMFWANATKHQIREFISNQQQRLDSYLRAKTTRISIFRQAGNFAFSTLIGMISINFIVFAFLIACSYDRGINERTLSECAAGFVSCLFSAWYFNWHFHRLYRAEK